MQSHTTTSKGRTSRFSSTSPPRHHFLTRYAYLCQIDDNEASVRTVCTHAEVRWHFSGNWIGHFSNSIFCCNFWRISFVLLGGQNYQSDDSLGPYTSIHYIGTFSSPTYGMRWLIHGKFRRFAAKFSGFVSIAMFREGRRQISRGAGSKYQCWY